MKRIAFILWEEEWRIPSFELAQAFDPSAKVFYEADPSADLSVTAAIEGEQLHFSAVRNGISEEPMSCFIGDKVLTKADYKKDLYHFLSRIYGRTLPWGVLTGIKPVKLTHVMLRDEGMTSNEAAQAMTARYVVSEKKARLAAELAERELSVVYPEGLSQVGNKRVSVYLGVPICPAKCSYCSFVSTVADKKGKLVSDYLNNLLIEIREMTALVREKHLVIDTLYIGGGTPSVFTADQTEKLLSALAGTFIHPQLREFTFEAGRPETTTPEKLRIMKAHGVSRICLNPQSMNRDTLMAVNRRHSPEDILRVYEQIRALDFNCVNMDLILGLNNESPEAFFRSLDRVINLAPENLTIHSLAIKHGSAIHESEGHKVNQLYDETFYDAIERRLSREEYLPYYLYRQKYTQGSGENIGYCKPGHPGIYNILMMAERQSILGIGAGSSGKVYDPQQDRFYKVFTVKDIRTYNERIGEIIERKMKDYESL